nr:Wadjet anti-phage system protein JetD domain-containing protein [Enterocloster clostridioformis]
MREQGKRVLSSIRTSCGTTYLHTGDLDYGGVKIFQYIKKSIFPNLQPYLMDTQTHEQYKAYGEPIETIKLEKLQRTTEPLL